MDLRAIGKDEPSDFPARRIEQGDNRVACLHRMHRQTRQMGRHPAISPGRRMFYNRLAGPAIGNDVGFHDRVSFTIALDADRLDTWSYHPHERDRIV
jgi:hypothetical protein